MKKICKIIEMNKYHWTSILLTILLIGLVAAVYRRGEKGLEGFLDTPKPQQADIDIGRTLQLLHNLGGMLINPANWTNRYNLIGKTPVELARIHLSQPPS